MLKPSCGHAPEIRSVAGSPAGNLFYPLTFFTAQILLLPNPLNQDSLRRPRNSLYRSFDPISSIKCNGALPLTRLRYPLTNPR